MNIKHKRSWLILWWIASQLLVLAREGRVHRMQADCIVVR